MRLLSESGQGDQAELVGVASGGEAAPAVYPTGPMAAARRRRKIVAAVAGEVCAISTVTGSISTSPASTLPSTPCRHVVWPPARPAARLPSGVSWDPSSEYPADRCCRRRQSRSGRTSFAPAVVSQLAGPHRTGRPRSGERLPRRSNVDSRAPFESSTLGPSVCGMPDHLYPPLAPRVHRSAEPIATACASRS